MISKKAEILHSLNKRYSGNYNEWIDRLEKIACNKNRFDISYYYDIPFCLNDCNYCSIVKTKTKPNKEYIDNLIYQANICYKYFPVKSDSFIWFGGGTPSLLTDNQFRIICENIVNNPKCIETDIQNIENAFNWAKEIRITNISIGVQSLLKTVRTKFNIQDTWNGDLRRKLDSILCEADKLNIKMNLDFICFTESCENSFKEIIEFMIYDVDFSVYPLVDNFCSSNFEKESLTDSRFACVDTFMKHNSFNKISPNGCYSRDNYSLLTKYFSSDIVIGLGKNGQIINKNNKYTGIFNNE